MSIIKLRWLKSDYVKLGVIVFMLIPILNVNAGGDVLDNWRYPNEEDYYYDWFDYKNMEEKPFYVEADFNDDGLKDKACFLFSLDEDKWGLFVFLSKGINGIDIIKLDENKNIEIPPQRMGINIVPAGIYKTACAKGYHECDSNEAFVLDVKSPMLNYFTFESANSYFYWNFETERFNQVWISD